MASAVEGLKERWEGITPRERGLVVLLGVSFVVVIIALVGFRIDDGLERIADKNAETRAALTELRSYRSNETRVAAKANTKNVSFGSTPLKLDDYLFTIADAVGITIPKVDKPNESKKGKFMESSTKISLRGLTIVQLKDLLQRIESDSKVVVITDLFVRRHFRKNDQLNIEMTIATYFKKPPDKKKKGEKKGS